MEIETNSGQELILAMNELQIICTAKTVSVGEPFKVRWQTKVAKDLADAFLVNQKWVRASNQTKLPIQIIYKKENGKMEVLFLEHAENHSYGQFQPENMHLFVNLLKKLKNNALKENLILDTIGMLGCEVTLELKDYVSQNTGISIRTLPHYAKSTLQVKWDEASKCYKDFVYNAGNKELVCAGKLQKIIGFMS